GSGGDDAAAAPVVATKSAPALARPCPDAIDDVYRTPPGLPPFEADGQGDIVRCARDATIGAAQMRARIAAAGVRMEVAPGDASTFRVSYRTRRADGTAALSSARVYLPARVRAPLPVLVAAHGTA